MSESSLVTRKWWANESNYTKGRTDIIRGIVIHHAASTSLDSIGTVFSQYGRGGSAHYGVGGNQIHQYVSESDCAWHCSNWAGNNATVGIETTNSTGAPDWKVADDTLATLIKLVADIAKRNNLGKLWINPDADFPALSGHKDWYGAATVCPGPYLYPKLQYICDEANKINYPPAPSVELIWTPLESVTVYLTAKEPTILYDFNHSHAENCKTVKEFHKDEEMSIAGRVTNKTIGKTYLLTEYSWNKKITNGFLETDMVVKPEPQPEPTPEPTPGPEPEPTPEPTPEPDPTVGILQKIIDFIKHIIDLITKKQGE